MRAIANRCAAALTALTLAFGSVNADEVRVDGMRVGAFGIYREKLDRIEPSAKTAMGYLRIVTERELMQQTET